MKEVIIDTNKNLCKFFEAIAQARQEATSRKAMQQMMPIMFRGQPNANLDLSSTLQRNIPNVSQLSSFKLLINSIIPHINSELNVNYQWCDLTQRSSFNPYLQNQQLMINLRQYGFTSPLLDFSVNPLVALYFAFRDAVDGTDAAVYMFERTRKNGGEFSFSADGPHLHIVHHLNHAVMRHKLQEACYLYCVDCKEDPSFVPFKDFFDNPYDEQENVLTKFVFHDFVRLDVLDMLDSFGINEFKLFDTYDALVKTIEHKTVHSRSAVVIGDGIQILVAKSQR